MKIYFDGCSWTRGAELEKDTEERYSKLLCDHYNAEETNLAFDGKSNDAIIRELYLDQPEPDLAVIQMTFPLRTEFYDANIKKWFTINVSPSYKSWKVEKSEENVKNSLSDMRKQKLQDFWVSYYVDIVSNDYFVMKEKMQMEQIKTYFSNKNIPLVLMTINHATTYEFDLNLSKRPYPHAPKNHPTKEGHQMIKDDILNIVKMRGID